MYFTERLQEAFHMIFTSYDKTIAQEGLRKLESIVNTLSATNHSIPAMASVSTTDAIQEDSPTQRELGDAYALLARVYGGPQFTPEELGFPEDNIRTYQYLHNSIRYASPIGTLQALRIAGSITPTVERDMTLSFDDAFTIVLHHANEGDAYCQYIIGNVYFWEDYHRISTAKARINPAVPNIWKRINKAIRSQTLPNALRALQGTVNPKELEERGTTEATYWFTKALDNGLALFQGNLRNIYIDADNLDMARATAKVAAHLGNPTMMLYAGLDAHERGQFTEAFTWFQQGAEKGQTECISELADYYFHFYDDETFQQTIPFDPLRAVELYTEAASRNFHDAGYAALQAAFAYIFHMGPLPLDWGRIADLVHTAAIKDRYFFALPYISYTRLHGAGVAPNIRYAVQSLLRLLEEERVIQEKENRILFYDITSALTRVAMGYAYEKGYVTDEPDLDKAVQYYEESHQYILRYKKYLASLADHPRHTVPLDDEGAERLQAFEQINGHWTYKKGITESTTTVRLKHTTYPHNAIRLAVEEHSQLWDTTIYNWSTIENALEKHKTIRLSWYSRYLSVTDYLRNIYNLTVKAMPNHTYQLTISGYHYDEGQELRYETICTKDETYEILHTLYYEECLPNTLEGWAIVKAQETSAWHYVLDIDDEQFLLENYDDATAMIQASLEGIKSKRYQQVNIRTHDFIGPPISFTRGINRIHFASNFY
ncbi:tetratricopeptide repeat protein [Veillonella agrestimuris]|uniref:tetratricopeptide repeat protein n=1 Tax=Veillonella agrestimuris TaxID=2941340 RepID=UPI002040B47E|nr:sel1 repeat family protein [Veillonella agrestimuris]